MRMGNWIGDEQMLMILIFISVVAVLFGVSLLIMSAGVKRSSLTNSDASPIKEVTLGDKQNKIAITPFKASHEDVITVLETILEGFKLGDTQEFNIQVSLNFDTINKNTKNKTPWDIVGMMGYGQRQGQGYGQRQGQGSVRFFHTWRTKGKYE